MTAVNQPLLDELVKHRAAIKRRFRLAWLIYVVNTAVTLVLYWLYPEDRSLLSVYLFAALGPLIAQAYYLSLIRPFAWVRRFPLHMIALGAVTAGLVVRGFLGTRQDLYVYLLLAMGPALFMSSKYTAAKLLERLEG
jgi:hypothetical protein